MKRNSIVSILLMTLFLLSISVISESCGSSKGTSKVKSGSGMGNHKHKNKHVWGK
mgnify:CR=1 FL=1|tara:strand:- start:9751 stop:9915 length:165 start_codon:yes stop_codon:yes gene_type:complete